MATVRLQCWVNRLENDPHASFAQHLEHAIDAELSQVAGGIRRVEEPEDLPGCHRRKTGRVRIRLDLVLERADDSLQARSRR